MPGAMPLQLVIWLWWQQEEEQPSMVAALPNRATVCRQFSKSNNSRLKCWRCCSRQFGPRPKQE